MKRLEGKVAVITGGNSGIGLATAQRFVEEGAHVFITGRRQGELDAAVRRIGKSVTGVQGDVSSLADLDRLYATVKERRRATWTSCSPTPALGNWHHWGKSPKPTLTKHSASTSKGFCSQCKRRFRCFRMAVDGGGGSIILNASVAASKGVGGFSVYNATKAAVRSFARTWTVDLKQRRIRVNAISPGPIDTPGFDGLLETDEQKEQFRAGLLSAMPLGRMGRPDEIAKAATFLASDDSSFITGIELFVDGGMAQI